jgi:chemotaxis family two-component system response regulator Rcp1
LYRDLHRVAHVLLVEDNPADVMLLKLGLEETGAACRLQIAIDGQNAIELLRQAAEELTSPEAGLPDLILLDLNLPKLNGHQVLRIIRSDPRFRLIPVVVLTSSISRSDVLSAYGAGANSYLQKPKSLESSLDLLRTIEHYWLELALLPTNGCGNSL